MRTRWKMFGGVGVVAVTVLLIGHSRVSHGDPSTTSSSSPAATTATAHNPATLYDLPGSTTYDELSAAEKASVDAVQNKIGASQPDASYNAFSSAAATMASDAQAQIAARAIGLVDTAQDGVVP